MVRHLVFLLLTIAVMSVADGFACSCMRSGTVDQEFNKAANVAVLKARSLERTEKEPPRLVNYDGIKQTTLTVEKVYKGNLKIGQEIILAQGGGADCVWTFTEESIGQEFLFYLGSGPLDPKTMETMVSGTGQFPIQVKKDVWVASTCSRSGNVMYRRADVRYLGNWQNLKGKTRLSGVVSRYEAPSTADQKDKFELLSGHKLVLTGNGKTIELMTDRGGVFEIYDIPAGNYTLTPDPIDGFKIWREDLREKIKITAGRQVELDFGFRVDNLVRGKLTDSRGEPLADVCLELLPSDGEKAKHFYESDCTNSDGIFEIDEVPTGSYVIVANKEGKLTATAPFATTYYPGTTKREDAGMISIGPGIKLEGLTIKVSETIETVKIKGVIVYEDGKSAGDKFETSISFYLRENSSASARDGDREAAYVTQPSKKTGEFIISIMKGQKGEVRGERLVYRDDYGTCPKLDGLLPKGSQEFGFIKTKTVTIDGNEGVTGIRLVLPFPSSCNKKH